MTRRLSCWVFEKRPAHCYVTIDVYLIVFAQCLVMHCKQDEQDRLSLAHESGGTKEYPNTTTNTHALLPSCLPTRRMRERRRDSKINILARRAFIPRCTLKLHSSDQLLAQSKTPRQ